MIKKLLTIICILITCWSCAKKSNDLNAIEEDIINPAEVTVINQTNANLQSNETDSTKVSEANKSFEDTLNHIYESTKLSDVTTLLYKTTFSDFSNAMWIQETANFAKITGRIASPIYRGCLHSLLTDASYDYSDLVITKDSIEIQDAFGSYEAKHVFIYSTGSKNISITIIDSKTGTVFYKDLSDDIQDAQSGNYASVSIYLNPLNCGKTYNIIATIDNREVTSKITFEQLKEPYIYEIINENPFIDSKKYELVEKVIYNIVIPRQGETLTLYGSKDQEFFYPLVTWLSNTFDSNQILQFSITNRQNFSVYYFDFKSNKEHDTFLCRDAGAIFPDFSIYPVEEQ